MSQEKTLEEEFFKLKQLDSEGKTKAAYVDFSFQDIKRQKIWKKGFYLQSLYFYTAHNQVIIHIEHTIKYLTTVK